MPTEFRASHMRCAPDYRYNDITVLVTGEPNSLPITSACLAESRPSFRACLTARVNIGKESSCLRGIHT